MGYQLYAGDGVALRRRRWQIIGALLLFGAVLIAAPIASAAYAMSRYLPARANTTPLYTLVLVMAACAYVAGAALRRKHPPSWRISRPLLALLAALMVLGLVQTLLNSLRQMDNMRTFNREWYAIHTQLQAAVARGEAEVTVTPFTFDLGNMIQGAPPQDPFHPQVRTYGNLAQYYDLTRVIPQGDGGEDERGK
ncbi:MAG: hypothetical protein D6712_01700 [Chloroflexi bacterium]|nr:MAG: hypothetical protein D6712_01700 [Chloroflexota bacterium]